MGKYYIFLNYKWYNNFTNHFNSIYSINKLYFFCIIIITLITIPQSF